MIPVRGYAGRRVAVLGLGRSGLSAAAALAAGGAEVIAWDDGEAARGKAAAAGITLVDLTRPGAFDGVALLVVSPGIPHLYPSPHRAVRAAIGAGVPLDNDIGLFFRSWASQEWSRFDTAPRVIAVTGSNGKSTTVALIHHVLEQIGRPAQMAGNIGLGVLDAEPARDGEVIVLELSSYQCELARTLTPDIAVFTNLADDHLDRHGGRGGYFAAKRRLFAEGCPDRAVIGIDQPEGLFLASQIAEGPLDDQVIRISSGQKLGGFGWSVSARRGFLSEWRKGRQVASLDLRPMKGLAGAHNHQNACAAWGALRALGLAPKEIGKALASFPGLAHRCRHIADIGDVAFVNDSKATNAESAAHALRAFPRIRWIAGGEGKEGGIEALAPDFANVEKAYLIGRDASRFAATLAKHGIAHEISGTLEAAFASATREARPGETVLLAPAAASFDQFESFEARGAAFERLVQQARGGGDAR